MPPIDKIIAFENGELSHDEIVDMIQDMIDDDSVWQLQGSYGRLAMALVQSGDCHLKERG